MDEPTRAYLEELDAPAPVRERVAALLRNYHNLGVHEFQSFVSETVGDDGTRQFESLWLFNRTSVMEAALREDESAELDGVRLDRALTRWAVKVRSFDLETWQPETRMSVDLWFSDEILGQLSASGANCLRLVTLLREYVVPITNAP